MSAGRRFSRGLGHSFLWLVLLAGCRSPWPAAENFQKNLTCGLSPDAIGSLARSYGAHDIGCPAPKNYEAHECYIGEGTSLFSFHFDKSQRLISVARGHFVGLSGLEMSKEIDLCRGRDGVP